MPVNPEMVAHEGCNKQIDEMIALSSVRGHSTEGSKE
jgi:hypothetical protein